MTERAEGFWWVRVNGGTWCTGEVERAEVKNGNGRTTLMLYTRRWSGFASVRSIEWGPYLGKSPSDGIELLGLDHLQPSEALALVSERLIETKDALAKLRGEADPKLDKELRRHERDD